MCLTGGCTIGSIIVDLTEMAFHRRQHRHHRRRVRHLLSQGQRVRSQRTTYPRLWWYRHLWYHRDHDLGVPINLATDHVLHAKCGQFSASTGASFELVDLRLLFLHVH